ncbi:hypothetical protein BC940DRAFT_292919 [Gongronella butleri]|nr:hypothetical protein BC940DRAFT_292919 [Gongronella butleri]
MARSGPSLFFCPTQSASDLTQSPLVLFNLLFPTVLSVLPLNPCMMNDGSSKVERPCRKTKECPRSTIGVTHKQIKHPNLADYHCPESKGAGVTANACVTSWFFSA